MMLWLPAAPLLVGGSLLKQPATDSESDFPGLLFFFPGPRACERQVPLAVVAAAEDAAESGRGVLGPRAGGWTVQPGGPCAASSYSDQQKCFAKRSPLDTGRPAGPIVVPRAAQL